MRNLSDHTQAVFEEPKADIENVHRIGELWSIAALESPHVERRYRTWRKRIEAYDTRLLERLRAQSAEAAET